MGTGKSARLIDTYTYYRTKAMDSVVRVFKSSIDTRDEGVIHSRNENYTDIPCETISPTQTFAELLAEGPEPDVILVDEAQFLTEEQVNELSDIADYRDITVGCYGLSTDFQTKLFPGSKRLFELSDCISNLLHDSSYRHVNARIDKNGEILVNGFQVEVGAEDKYCAMERKDFKKRLGDRAKVLFPTKK